MTNNTLHGLHCINYTLILIKATIKFHRAVRDFILFIYFFINIKMIVPPKKLIVLIYSQVVLNPSFFLLLKIKGQDSQPIRI